MNLKYKLLSLDELIINLDRLSRFKLPEYTFTRVFETIVLKNLIEPKLSKQDVEKINAKQIAQIVEKIWNESVNVFSTNELQKNDIAYQALKCIVNNSFKNIDEREYTFINSNLNIAPVLKLIDYDKAPKNLKFLVNVSSFSSSKITQTNNSFFEQLRERYSLCFPIKKVLIVEGITEEILLPVFSKKINQDFDKCGIYILSAGGKSKSPALYMKLKDRLNIPIILLFDFDAKEICNTLEYHLLPKDKIILIQKGEFEDILPLTLIKRALNNEYLPATQVSITELKIYNKMCDNLESFYRTRHLGEFKKSKFAKIISETIKYKTDISNEIKSLIYHCTN